MGRGEEELDEPQGWYLAIISGGTATRRSKTHKVKRFADDLSLFSSAIKDHAAVLQAIDEHC